MMASVACLELWQLFTISLPLSKFSLLMVSDAVAPQFYTGALVKI